MASQDNYQLIVRRGPEPNKSIALDQDVMTLGRDITNEITISDPEVSRHHARFTRGPQGYQMEDIGSTNGTFVAGQRLSTVLPLSPGDIIGFGETVILEYQLVRGPEEIGPSSPTMQGAAAIPQAPQQPPAQPVQPAQPQEYTPPKPAYDQQQPGYPPQQEPQPPAYDQQPYPAQQQPDYGYGAPQQAPTDYDYDPYAVREDQPSSMMNWLLIGCVVVLFFCCFCTIVTLFVIDGLNLWDKWPFEETITPIAEGIKNALGF